ncbi:MAG: flavodoxin [Clostridia bacterium]|nr:flavodoxin [Clostridia bacterium]
MKKIKILAVLLAALMMAFSFAACGGTGNTENKAEDADAQAEDTASDAAKAEETPADEADADAAGADSEGGALVVYFSRTGEQYKVGVIDEGNTAIVAKMIAERTGADMFEIMPAEDTYPTTYDELTEVAKREQSENARPAYAGEAPDLSKYDTIFIGSPVWWGDWPMIMYTFFEENGEALSGKRLVPFSTHEGSGLSGFGEKLSRACPGSDVADGFAVTGSDAQNKPDEVREDVNEWLSGLGY